MPKLLNKTFKIVLSTFIVLFPSFLLTNVASYFDFPKLLLLVTTVIVLVVLWSVKIVSDGKVTLPISKADLPLLLLVVAYVASALVKTPNKMEAFAMPGTATILIGAFLAYIFSKIAFKGQKELLGSVLFLSASVVGLISILAFGGVLGKIPQLPAVIRDINFSPVGGKLPEVIFLVSLLPLGISLAINEKDSVKKVLYFVGLAVVGLSAVLSGYLMLPGKAGAPVIVDFQTSWSVAVDTLKASPIFGIGTANYLSAFTRYLPLAYNSTDLWANRFFSASSYVLTLLTETGIFGLTAFAFAVVTLLKGYFKNFRIYLASQNKSTLLNGFTLIILIVSMLVLPANSLLVVLFFLLAALNSSDNDVLVNLSATSERNGNIFVSKIPSFILAAVLIGLTIYPMYFVSKILNAEMHYKKGIDAIVTNNAKVAYDELRLAININPSIDRYHATFDQLDLALARGLAQKKDITDQDKNTVAQLIQQAIGEAKAAVALNPQRSANWELLARTYQSIIPFAQGADNFTIVSFNQAIALDPISPNLRIALGGVYYSLGKYDDAINAFGLAVTAKPDLANAHYNLALAYNQKKDYEKATIEMNKVLSLVSPDSEDYQVAKKALEELEKNKPAKTVESDNLTPPQPVGTSTIKPPLELPQDATPPSQPTQ